jgi:hypothetical protein
MASTHRHTHLMKGRKDFQSARERDREHESERGREKERE